MNRLFILPFLLQMAFGDSLTVPSFTAYLDPNPNGARVTTDAGITRWSDPKIKVQWFGQINSIGELTAKVEVELNKDDKLNLSLTLGKEIRKVTLIGKGTSPVIADFGKFNIKKKGYHSFALSSPAPRGKINSLILDGPAMTKAHFNLKPRRNSASVHLSYPIERGE
jgi:hypothetical protein